MTLIGDYEIVETVGSTSHAVVHLARPPERLGGNALVRLKSLKQHAGEDDFRRIANELRVLHQVQSAHVVELLDAGTIDGQLFVVTRHYPEGTLAETQIERSTGETCAIVAGAARGVHALHDVGIAHRDVRPGNIFISGGRGLIGNLDLAQLLAGASTAIGGPLGALEFLAPELVRGGDANRRTDVWSLAMALHRALSGTCAVGEIPSTSLLEACRYVMCTEPVIDSSIVAPVADFLTTCLTPDPSDRPSTANVFADELDALRIGALS